MADKPNPAADPHQPLHCPRCDSSNTKFCYYNNYSLSQPRHFCKSCKRYWTRGGTLRNVPVGGACRKNKRSKRHQQIDLPSNPLFANPPELNFPFSSFRVSSGFDQIQTASSFSSAANNSILFGSSFSTNSTMASLLHYEDPGMGKQAEAEGENRSAWNPNMNTNPIIDQINSFDPSSSSLVWNASTSSGGAWFDPSTMGYSVPSLI